MMEDSMEYKLMLTKEKLPGKDSMMQWTKGLGDFLMNVLAAQWRAFTSAPLLTALIFFVIVTISENIGPLLPHRNTRIPSVELNVETSSSFSFLIPIHFYQRAPD
ncbi:unnamed protein product [Nezara viridula]|uniref:Uncharacterized protein n=1 Tax=Nezara viridula TaxID=85310 RepID=A0A9P0E1V6_NEZVI|nr:unnamed protein product [Nezara viridula]